MFSSPILTSPETAVGLFSARAPKRRRIDNSETDSPEIAYSLLFRQSQATLFDQELGGVLRSLSGFTKQKTASPDASSRLLTCSTLSL